MPELLGDQTPRIRWVPESYRSSGADATELAETAGLLLDPWQRLVLDDALGERRDGRWTSFETGLVVARQNGKGAIFEARVLAGLFLFDERLIMYSCHEFKSAQEFFRRIRLLIDGKDEFRRRVRKIVTAHGDEGIELTTGQRLRVIARSTGSGRGFSGDLNIWDEAFNLPSTAVDAQMPTMSARPNPQAWYGSSAADKTIAPCEQLAAVRRRGIAGDDPALTYLEWSIDPHTEQCARDAEGTITCIDHDDRDDPASWAKANPSLGIRISVEHVQREYNSMSPTGFDRERLSVGNWPTDKASQWTVIPEAKWRAVADEQSEAEGRVAFAIHVSPDRSWAAIATAGRRADGLLHLEVVDYRPGTRWVPDRAAQLQKRWDPVAWVVDAGGPAGSLIADLEAVRIEDPQTRKVTTLEITKPTAREVAHAFGQLLDAVMPEEGDPGARVRPHPALDAAVAGAATRKLGTAHAWDALTTAVDISSLVAVTSAAWGFATKGHVEDEAPEPWVQFG
ncbi:terminase [Spongiactinospora rosea]|uniref:Terminase n=1 Tax=Spongiactinospora rosea TaxID=2248750 RepID=A0A366M816_9ACTN|nr:terminase [Spongiactinospora rosea]